jgi:hypothetical protein
MRCIFFYIFLFHYFETISSSINNIPVIYNVSLRMLNYNATIMNGTCHECLCAMVLNVTSIYCFNCFQNNGTCEIFSTPLTTSSFSLMNNSASSVYFSSLPIDDSTSTIASIAQSTNNLSSKSRHLRTRGPHAVLLKRKCRGNICLVINSHEFLLPVKWWTSSLEMKIENNISRQNSLIPWYRLMLETA